MFQLIFPSSVNILELQPVGIPPDIVFHIPPIYGKSFPKCAILSLKENGNVNISRLKKLLNILIVSQLAVVFIVQLLSVPNVVLLK
jgi:hypothetical protein